MPRKTCKVFMSYAPMDSGACRKLLRLLQVQTALSESFDFLFWDDRPVLEDEQLKPEIDNAIAACDMGLLLISPHYVGSEFVIGNELRNFLGESAKPAVVVEINGGTELNADTKGLVELDPFRDGKRPFKICTGRQQKLFVQKLYERLEAFATKVIG